AMSAVYGTGSGGYLIFPRSAWKYAAPAGLLLVRGPALDQAALAAATRKLQQPTVFYRSRLLASLSSAPLPHGTYTALAAAGDIAAAAAVLLLLLTLVMSAESRQQTLARLTTMGLTARQSRRLALIEA